MGSKITYAVSDIHGCLDKLEEKMELVDLKGDNRIIFLGDYIEYGWQSGQVLQFIYDLQNEYGTDKVIVLKGNHEDMILNWIDEYSGSVPETDEMLYDSWFKTDSEQGYKTFRTLVTEEQLAGIRGMEGKVPFGNFNREAVRMVLETNGQLVQWMRSMKSYFQTDTQIYVHAGVDEEAEEYWMWGTGDEVFLWKHPASFGAFYKTVIAGHVGTSSLAREKGFHDVFYDGASHYYIDGTAAGNGKLLLLAYDEDKCRYYQVEQGISMPVTSYISL
ncbi:MAG: metallophosphoesterase [Clostridiales bacterium]|nr:metallophosphoesterase [Clostridiales bacterium]